MLRLLMNVVAISLLLFGVRSAQAAPITAADIVANWTPINSPLQATSTTWVESGGTVLSGSNGTGALVSNFSSAGDFAFSTNFFAPSGTADSLGILFGFQDLNNHYRLSWQSSTFSSGEFDGLVIFKEQGGATSVLASVMGLHWFSGTTYTTTVSRTGNDLSLDILQGTTPVYSSGALTDSTFMTGKVGFHVFDQTVNFSNADFEVLIVPEPSTAILLTFGTLLLLAYRLRGRVSGARSEPSQGRP